jgi:osmotically inducible lipoprotein OsmB
VKYRKACRTASSSEKGTVHLIGRYVPCVAGHVLDNSTEAEMKRSFQTLIALALVAGMPILAGCTLGGAAAGGVIGHETTHSTAGTVGGAVVGGVIGHEIGKD